MAKALRHAGETYGVHVRSDDRYPRVSLLEAEGQVHAKQAQKALRALIEDVPHDRLDAAEPFSDRGRAPGQSQRCAPPHAAGPGGRRAAPRTR
jgi:hypothetical protein